MSKKAFKSQASSSKAGFGTGNGFLGSAPFGQTLGSALSYVYEPPDLNRISDAVVVVSFKNLQKKDSTTKAKALEELQACVNSLGGDGDSLEDAFLDAWARLFPRTSIENTHRVRQLAYGLQGSIAALCGKRFIKYMPATVGAWLAGFHDGDRLVARSAQESFNKTFSTDEKKVNVWKAFQDSILEYSLNTVFKETPQTLSDERSVNPDDAESKYSRAIGGALLLVATALKTLPEADLQKKEDAYKEILGSNAVWGLASYKDSFLRRAVYRLVPPAILVSVSSHLLDFQMAGNSMLKALDTEQTGSMGDFLTCLIGLSKAQPEIWTTLYTGSSKKPPSKRLFHFLRKGTQGDGGDHFWMTLLALIDLVPYSVIEPEIETEAKDDSRDTSKYPALRSLREGITRRKDTRALQKDGWMCYMALARKILNHITEPSAREGLVKDWILPLVQHSVKPTSDPGEWTSSSLDQHEAAETAIMMAFYSSPQTLEDWVKALSQSLVRDLETSLPEQSKDFSKAHDDIATEFERWTGIRAFISSKGEANLTKIFFSDAETELDVAISVLERNNGKPYSAAAVLCQMANLLSIAKDHANGTTEIEEPMRRIADRLVDFAANKAPLLICSPSSFYLFQTLKALEPLGPPGSLDNAWESSVQALTTTASSDYKEVTLKYLASLEPWPQQPGVQALLSAAILENCQDTLASNKSGWSLIDATMKNVKAPDSVKEEILFKMTSSLSINTESGQALRGLERIAKQEKGVFQKLLKTAHGSDLLTKLLYLSQEGDETIKYRASKLKDAMYSPKAKENLNSDTMHPVLNIIKECISSAGEDAVSVETLVSQALELLRIVPLDQARGVLDELLPDHEQSAKALDPFLEQPVHEALALTNPLGGSVYLLPNTKDLSELVEQGYDAEGRSSPLRISLFLAKLAGATDFLQLAADQFLLPMYHYVSIIAQLASDHLSLPPHHPLFDRSKTADGALIVDAVAEIQSFCTSWLRNGSVSTESWLDRALSEFYNASQGLNTKTYYTARAYAAAVSWLKESHADPLKLGGKEHELSRVVKNPIILSDIALLAGSSGSATLIKIMNELLADLASLDFGSDPRPGLEKSIVLNTIFQIEGLALEEIPKQRIVFFVQHVSGVLQSPISEALKSEILKALAASLPFIEDIYGEFWESIINTISEALMSDMSPLPLVHISLRLCNILSKLAADDSNEDLQESWVESEAKIAQGLLSTLRRNADASDSFNQPLKIVNSLLSRQISTFASAMELELEDLYPLMASESTTLQRSAYEILHKAIPLAQGQVSIDAALSKDSVVKLPEELLSLILEAPILDDYLDLHREAEIPSVLSRYLLSWKLLFDHWTNASYKVQAAYVSSLKENACLPALLTFVFDLLIGSRSKNAINPSSLPSIVAYEPSPSLDPGTETHQILSHLYYLALAHTPQLSKDWHTNSCPRALKYRVENWTEKHISPLVIDAELATLDAWEPPSEQSSTEFSSDLTIKVSAAAREALASFPIDDTHISIRISFPPTYPLSPLAITSGSHIGIEQRKWDSFLNIARLIASFSSTSQGLGCTIDAVSSWKNNTQAALKGHTECAICYSIVSEDRKLPDKTCATCAKKFHGICLWKWFKRSGGGSCPMCRNNFTYAG